MKRRWVSWLQVPVITVVLVFGVTVPSASAKTCSECTFSCCGARRCFDPFFGLNCHLQCAVEGACSLFGDVDAVATVSADGRHLSVTGPITCSAETRIRHLAVTVTQRGGAVAEGYTRGRCTGQEQQFQVAAPAQGLVPFAPGPARACVLATLTGPVSRDAWQWCEDVTLEAE